MHNFKFKVIKNHQHTKARITTIDTPHGKLTTPTFMPVGTRAGVNNITPRELIAAGSQIILGGNTYHMLCAPEMKIIENAGGMHNFMGWHKPMLTDSGGFQVFSLAKHKKLDSINEEGVWLQLPANRSLIQMTPESSIACQKIIGADLIMAFDQCTPDSCNLAETAQIMQRTHRWLKRSLAYHQQEPNSRYGRQQALFGIIQGGKYRDLRRESAAFVAAQLVDGVAIGGESIGFNMTATVEIIQLIYDLLPIDKPRYTMGVGMSPQDLFDVVAQGIDLFDCVAPTRNARHGALFCGEITTTGNWLKFASDYQHHRLQINKKCFANDFFPIMATCNCYTCQNYSRAFLHKLYKQKEPVFTALASIHNVAVMHAACTRMRSLILTDVPHNLSLEF